MSPDTSPTSYIACTPLPFGHSSRAFFLTALTVPYHLFSRFLLQLLRSSLSTTSCKEISKLQYSFVCSRVRATTNYAAILTRQLKIGSRDNVPDFLQEEPTIQPGHGLAALPSLLLFTEVLHHRHQRSTLKRRTRCQVHTCSEPCCPRGACANIELNPIFLVTVPHYILSTPLLLLCLLCCILIVIYCCVVT